MHSGFSVSPVEVDVSTCESVDESGREAEDAPQQGTHLGDFVDVEAGVKVEGSLIDEVEEVAVSFASVVEEYMQLTPPSEVVKYLSM